MQKAQVGPTGTRAYLGWDGSFSPLNRDVSRAVDADDVGGEVHPFVLAVSVRLHRP